MFEIGRLCIKNSGRDAGEYCVVVNIIDDNFVLIDGNTRRKKCNIKHIEPLNKVIKIKKNAPREEIHKMFVSLKLNIKKRRIIKKSGKSTKEKPIKKKVVKKKVKK